MILEKYRKEVVRIEAELKKLGANDRQLEWIDSHWNFDVHPYLED